MGLKRYFCTFLFLVTVLCQSPIDPLAHSPATDALVTTAHTTPASGPRIPRLASKHTLDAESEDANLLDIVLVASVNGRFHAVNRTSGRKLWTMSSSPGGDFPPNLAPLVRTKHVSNDSGLRDDEGIHQELYVIEPQSGDIYVMATPTSSLQPLSLSMSELVEMSPLKLAGDDGERVFVGKKETSLLSIELETGRVQAINAECPWDPFEDLNSKDDIDLDELEDHIPYKDISKSTQVFIGRTGGCCVSFGPKTIPISLKITMSLSIPAQTPIEAASPRYKTCHFLCMDLIAKITIYKPVTSIQRTTLISILSQTESYCPSRLAKTITVNHI